MTKIARVQPHIHDSVLRDPFEPTTYLPNQLIQRSDVSFAALGLLLEMLATNGDWDIEEARESELKRRAAGSVPEDVDELLGELEAAGYVDVTDA